AGGTATVAFTSAKLLRLLESVRQPVGLVRVLGRDSELKLGAFASIPDMMADNSFYCNSFATASRALPTSCCREAGGFGRRAAGRCPNPETPDLRHVHLCDRTACDLQPPRLVEPRRAVGGTDCAGGRAHRRRAAARRRRRPDGCVADRADPALHPRRDPGGPARRPHVAAIPDGGLRSTARHSAGGDPAAD